VSQLALFARTMEDMKWTLLALLLIGCGTDVPVTPDGSTGGGGDGGGGGGGPALEVSGHITSDVTWAQPISVVGATTIDPGVTVTVAGGTAITVAATASITVGGTLLVQGTSGSEVTADPAVPGGHWPGLSIPSGGVLEAHYYQQLGGGIHLTGGMATIIDSRMARASGDYLTMAGGTIDVEYSAFGLEPGMADTTHCDLHVGSGTVSLKVTHSNIATAAYGMMFYTGQAADFTYNNWFSNGTDVAITPGVSGDFSYGWFEKAAPSGAGITAGNLASSRIADAGPRP